MVIARRSSRRVVGGCTLTLATVSRQESGPVYFLFALGGSEDEGERILAAQPIALLSCKVAPVAAGSEGKTA